MSTAISGSPGGPTGKRISLKKLILFLLNILDVVPGSSRFPIAIGTGQGAHRLLERELDYFDLTPFFMFVGETD